MGNSNVPVDCFMKALAGRIPENTAGNKGDRQLAVRKVLQWNTGREAQKIRCGEAESRRMGYENLQWRRKLISDTVAKVCTGGISWLCNVYGGRESRLFTAESS